jgi:hypothetical protein
MSEDVDDSGNDFFAYRCPLCQKGVQGRPVSVFLVKAIAEGVLRYLERTGTKIGELLSPSLQGDPWADIFPPSDDEEEGKDIDEELYSPTFFRVAGSRYRTT